VHFCPGGNLALVETLRVSGWASDLPKKECSGEHEEVENVRKRILICVAANRNKILASSRSEGSFTNMESWEL